MRDLPETDISLLLRHPLFDIESGGDKNIEDALIVIERKLQSGEWWSTIILHHTKGMLLLKESSQPGRFVGLWLKSPTCGNDSQDAQMTSYILGRVEVGAPTEELHENFVSKYESVLFRGIDGPAPSREPF